MGTDWDSGGKEEMKPRALAYIFPDQDPGPVGVQPERVGSGSSCLCLEQLPSHLFSIGFMRKVSLGKRAGKPLTSFNWSTFRDGETEVKGVRTRKSTTELNQGQSGILPQEWAYCEDLRIMMDLAQVFWSSVPFPPSTSPGHIHRGSWFKNPTQGNPSDMHS